MNDLQSLLDSTSRISFEHLNPHDGHETILLRFEDSVTDQTTCLLVDAGENVSLDDTLGDEEYLGAVLLTHAHLDHYRSLPDVHRDGAPVYTSPQTAEILETVFASGTTNYGLDAANTADIQQHITELEGGWISVTDAIDVAAIPAGHTPGACGFVVRFDDGSGPHHILITGDFTARDAAGNPGFEPPIPLADGDVHVDALVLTQATSDTAAGDLTDAVATTLDRIRAGSPTLVTASGLTGVHLAVVLAAARTPPEGEPDEPLVVAGQAAKLYRDLQYDVPAVETVPVFEDPGELFERGAAVITGPEVPVDGGALRCFETIRDDPNATLVQVHSGSLDPIESAGCTTYDIPFSNHPPQKVIDDLVVALNPFSIVIAHDRTHGASEYDEDNRSFIWAPDYQDRQDLYKDGEWLSPEWVGEGWSRRVKSHHRQHSQSGETLSEEALPPITRRAQIDLEAEGIDPEALPAPASTSRSTTDDPIDAQEDNAKLDETDAAVTPVEENGEESSQESLAARVADLEATVDELVANQSPDGETVSVPVRVVDAGEDLTLLRVDGDEFPDLPHGTTLQVTVDEDTIEGPESTDSK